MDRHPFSISVELKALGRMARPIYSRQFHRRAFNVFTSI